MLFLGRIGAMSQQQQDTTSMTVPRTMSARPVGWATFGFVVVFAAMFGGLVILALARQWSGTTVGNALVVVLCLHGIGCTWVIIQVMHRHQIPWREVGVVRPTRTLWHLVWQVPVGLLTLGISNLMFVSLFLGSDATVPDRTNDFLAALPPLFAAIGLVGAGILTPIWEELFFRGMLLRLFQLTIGVRWAVVGSSVIFAFVHLNPLFFFYLFCGGLIMALMRRIHGNIWAPMAFHMVMNTMVSLMVIIETTS